MTEQDKKILDKSDKLHEESLVVDLHNHPTLKASLFSRNLKERNKKWLSTLFREKFWPLTTRSNFPSVKQGGVNVLLSTVYAPELQWADHIKLIKWMLWLYSGVREKYFDPPYFDITTVMMDEIERQVEEQEGFQFAKRVDEIDEIINEGNICLLHSIEGAHSLQGEVSGKLMRQEEGSPAEVEGEIMGNLEKLYERGVVYLTLAHFYPNQVVSPVFPYPDYGLKHTGREIIKEWDMTEGLTPIGERVVEKMIELGMMIDVSHCTLPARKRIYEIAEASGVDSCVFSTHTGAFEVNRDLYNLQDWEIKWIADHGGVVGIIFMNYWISPVNTGMGLKYIEETLKHIIKVSNVNVPAIGTDFDGFTDPPDELIDTGELPHITRYLLSCGYDETIVRNFLGLNAFSMIKRGWKR